jgi:hypothetical protein
VASLAAAAAHHRSAVMAFKFPVVLALEARAATELHRPFLEHQLITLAAAADMDIVVFVVIREVGRERAA